MTRCSCSPLGPLTALASAADRGDRYRTTRHTTSTTHRGMIIVNKNSKRREARALKCRQRAETSGRFRQLRWKR